MRLTHTASVRLMSGIVLLLLTAPCHADVSIRGLGFLSAMQLSNATGISADGSVVIGTAYFGSSQRPVFWNVNSISSLQQLPLLAGDTDVTPTSVSANGSVILAHSYTGLGRDLRTSNGISQPLVNPAGTQTAHPSRLSPDGTFVVGTASISGLGSVAVRWNGVSPGSPLPLPPSSSSAAAVFVGIDGSIYGVGSNGIDQHAVMARWTNGTPTTLASLPFSAGMPQAAPISVSSDGATILGYTFTPGTTTFYDTWLWTAAGGFQNFPRPAGTTWLIPGSMTADASLIIATTNSAVPTSQPVVWTPQSGMRTVTQFFQAAGVDLQGWTLDTAPSVSADGSRFAGTGLDPAGHREAYLVTIPAAPGAAALLMGLALASPRRRVPHRHGPSHAC